MTERRAEQVFLGLGSNLGDRHENLQRAVRELAEITATTVLRCSSVYETSPVGAVEQDDFLNQVLQIDTALSPENLLQEVQAIEQRLGRVRSLRWGPRTIDIDILIWGDRVVRTPTLTIPHPEITNRRFVLQPLTEIAGDFELPLHGKTVRQLLHALGDDDTKAVRVAAETSI